MNTTNQAPRLSVVMGVYNAEGALRSTLDSILQQSLSDFELIVVNDGSTDRSANILGEYSQQDSRIIVIDQENQGLTCALINGCDKARGNLIARHDAGDQSLPQRFQVQVDFMDAHQDVVAVSAGSRRIGPDDEFLGDYLRDLAPEQVTEEFVQDGRGLSHPASMFRTASYRQVGGYRREFRYAQDTDLWYRLSRKGLLAEIRGPLIELRVDLNGISAQNSHRQQLLADLAKASFDAVGQGRDDAQILLRATEASWGELPKGITTSGHSAQAKADYFIASQLYALKDSRCRRYFIRAIRQRPLWLRCWIRLGQSLILTKKRTTHMKSQF